MKSASHWGDIIAQADVGRFVGRGEQLGIFDEHIKLDEPQYPIFFITGREGVGKTKLLDRYRDIARDANVLLASCDEQQGDVLTVLDHLAQQFAGHGFHLPYFEQRYERYLQKVGEFEKDPTAPQGWPTLLAKVAVKGFYIGGDFVPGLRKGLEYIPREQVETQAGELATQAGEWMTYLQRKVTNRDDLALIREPIRILTSSFVQDLNKIAQKRRLLLCFDCFEAMQQELQAWFVRFPEHRPSPNIRMVIVGRVLPGAGWERLQNVTTFIRLEIFTKPEAELFLNISDIADAERRAEILELSGRVPRLMNVLTQRTSTEAGFTIPDNDIVERFLLWVKEPLLQQLVVLAALPRTFDVEVIDLLLKEYTQTDKTLAPLEWLKAMPFIESSLQGWWYRDRVRLKMIQHLRQKDPYLYRKVHLSLANFYKTKRLHFTSSGADPWTAAQWCQYTLAYAYHSLSADPEGRWAEIISLFVVALLKRWPFAAEFMRRLTLGDIQVDLRDEQKALVYWLSQQLQGIRYGNILHGFAMFDALCSMKDLSPEARGYAFAYRGECYRREGKLGQALGDFTEALRSLPRDAWIIANRGATYRLLGRYQEALADLNKAVTLDGKNAQVVAGRGITYSLLGRYQEALADLNKAVTLDGQNTQYRLSLAQVQEMQAKRVLLPPAEG